MPTKLPLFPRLGARPDQHSDSPLRSPSSPKANHSRQRSFNIPSLITRFSASSTTPQSTHLRTRSVEEESPCYATPHIGEPCTVASLDHILLCGHKILTSSAVPEPCARNCHIRRLKPDYAQPRDLDNSFACFACITAQIQNCIETAEIVDAMRTACQGMRISRPLWVEAEFEAAIEEVFAGKGKESERPVSSPAKGGAEAQAEAKIEVKGLEFKIPKYSGGVLNRVRGLTLGEDTKKN